jgi:hypothetical protein
MGVNDRFADLEEHGVVPSADPLVYHSGLRAFLVESRGLRARLGCSRSSLIRLWRVL